MNNKKKHKDFEQLKDQVDDIINKLDVSDIENTGVTKDIKEKIEKSTPKELDEIEQQLGINKNVEELIKELDKDNSEIPYAIESVTEEDKASEDEYLDEAIDGSFKINISEDKMTATIDLSPSKGSGKPLVYQEIKKAIEKMGIVYGVNYELLQKLVESVEKTKEEKSGVVIAQGTPPEEGEDGRIEYHFRESEDILLEKDDKNSEKEKLIE